VRADRRSTVPQAAYRHLLDSALPMGPVKNRRAGLSACPEWRRPPAAPGKQLTMGCQPSYGGPPASGACGRELVAPVRTRMPDLHPERCLTLSRKPRSPDGPGEPCYPLVSRINRPNRFDHARWRRSRQRSKFSDGRPGPSSPPVGEVASGVGPWRRSPGDTPGPGASWWSSSSPPARRRPRARREGRPRARMAR
jgi:hypothetical protein